MKYVYEMSALRIVSKMERLNFKEIADLVGINNNSVTRYANGSRLPDLNTLIHICNTLHLSIGTFIHHPDISILSIQTFSAKDFVPIRFHYDAIENFRKEKGIDRVSLLRIIYEETGKRINPTTYTRLRDGHPVGVDLPIAFLNAFSMDLSYLFEDRQLMYMKETSVDENIVIPRTFLAEMKERIRFLEEENRRLYTENKRMKTREHARYMGTDIQIHAEREMRTFVRKAERALADLKSFISD